MSEARKRAVERLANHLGNHPGDESAELCREKAENWLSEIGAVFVDPALVEAVESHAAAGVGARQEALQVLGEAILAQLRGGG